MNIEIVFPLTQHIQMPPMNGRTTGSTFQNQHSGHTAALPATDELLRLIHHFLHVCRRCVKTNIKHGKMYCHWLQVSTANGKWISLSLFITSAGKTLKRPERPSPYGASRRAKHLSTSSSTQRRLTKKNHCRFPGQEEAADKYHLLPLVSRTSLFVSTMLLR